MFLAQATYADVLTKQTWETAYGRTVNAGTAEWLDEGPTLLANVEWGDPAAGYLAEAFAVRAVLDSGSGHVRVEEATWRGRPAYEVSGPRDSE